MTIHHIEAELGQSNIEAIRLDVFSKKSLCIEVVS